MPVDCVVDAVTTKTACELTPPAACCAVSKTRFAAAAAAAAAAAVAVTLCRHSYRKHPNVS